MRCYHLCVHADYSSCVCEPNGPMPVMTYNEYPPAKSSDDTCVVTDGGHPDEPCDDVTVYPHGNGECKLGSRCCSCCVLMVVVLRC